MNGLLINIFNDFFTMNCNIHSYYTRQSKQLHVPKPKVSAFQNTLRFCGIKLWNQTYDRIQSNCSFSAYKQHVKKYLFAS